MEWLMELHLHLMAIAAGSGLGSMLVTWNRFLPFWKRNRLGFQGGLVGSITFIHQIVIMAGVLPVAVYVGSYMKDDRNIPEWILLAIIFISFLTVLGINKIILIRSDN